MDTMLIDSTASTTTRTVRQSTSMSDTATPYHHGYDITQRSSTPGTSSLFNFKWPEDGVYVDNSDCTRHRDGHSNRNEEDAFMFTNRRNACPFDADAYSDEPGQFTEWVYQPDEMERHPHPYYDGAEDDVPESMVASSSSASVWSHSGVASTASTSVDSLGLHHVTLASPGAESSSPPPLSAVSTVSTAAPGPDSPTGAGPVYDKTNFATASDSIWTQHELSELDITPIPPSSGTLVNWNSPLASWCAMDEDDDIERLLGQKRPRDAELDELVDRYKRRRTLPELWVQV